MIAYWQPSSPPQKCAPLPVDVVVIRIGCQILYGSTDPANLDLADLSSVRRFADSVDSVDVLINNAGVLGLPLTRTVDGFEAHMGTNHLGHFALTCLLGERITDRVICVSSAMYVFGRLHLDDLNWHGRRYWKWAAYTQSKLANLLFVGELASENLSEHGLLESINVGAAAVGA